MAAYAVALAMLAGLYLSLVYLGPGVAFVFGVAALAAMLAGSRVVPAFLFSDAFAFPPDGLPTDSTGCFGGASFASLSFPDSLERSDPSGPFVYTARVS